MMSYNLDLHVLTHSFPTRRSSDLMEQCDRDWHLVQVDPDRFLAGRVVARDRAGVHAPDRQLGLARPEIDERQARYRFREFRKLVLAATCQDRKSTRLNSSHSCDYRMPSYA